MSQEVLEIRNLVWKGHINLKITIDDSVCIDGLLDHEKTIYVTMRRNNYIVNYISEIIDQFSKVIKDDTIKYRAQNWWFEVADLVDTPLLWNYPVGVMFDTYNTSKSEFQSTQVHFWKLRLNYNSKPVFKHLIPIYDGAKQIQQYWMHQWKQACYIMHGNAKKMMSLKVQETESYWDSVLFENFDVFNKISQRMISLTTRVPIRISTPLQVIQPSCTSDMSLCDVLQQDLEGDIDTVIIQGIKVSSMMSVRDLYKRFVSFDGFLYVCVT